TVVIVTCTSRRGQGGKQLFPQVKRCGDGPKRPYSQPQAVREWYRCTKLQAVQRVFDGAFHRRIIGEDIISNRLTIKTGTKVNKVGQVFKFSERVALPEVERRHDPAMEPIVLKHVVHLRLQQH